MSEIANEMSFGSTDSKTRNLDLKERRELQFCFRLSGREFERIAVLFQIIRERIPEKWSTIRKADRASSAIRTERAEV